MSFVILTVCTGNICRSPVAELALARALSPVPEVRVASAGTGALVGGSVPRQAQLLAAKDGIDASSHHARQIDVSMIRDADLIVAMSREHRRDIVQALPGAMRRCFTLRELARVAEAVEPSLEERIRASGADSSESGMRAAVAAAAALRGTVPPPSDPDEFDVVDPYRRSDETYALSYSQLQPAVSRVAQYLLHAAGLASRS